MSELPVSLADGSTIRNSHGQHSDNTSYCFKWSNYQNHLSEVVKQLLDEECMVDVTIFASGEKINAHRIVLSACSSLFQDILSQVNDDHPTIILSDVSAEDVRAIIEFTYNGEVRIPVDNINNLLDAAHFLKISGLMEIEGLDETEILSDKDLVPETMSFAEFNAIKGADNNDDDDDDGIVHLDSENGDGSMNKLMNGKKRKFSSQSNQGNISNRMRRRSASKKDYTDEMFASAIEEIQSGCSLLDVAAKYRIPRSTLYMRAKILGIPLSTPKSDYTNEDMKAAIDLVLAGSSLQQAAMCYGIPKTVLWRRLQKEGYQTRHDSRKNYGADRREAAVKALQRGEGLTKVANEYKIPKTTLFRDKVRLVDEGKLPESYWKKRKNYMEGHKRNSLDEAVAACKEGRMSQAAASLAYKIPKTTIWRRLQKEIRTMDSDSTRNQQNIEENSEDSIEELKNNQDMDGGDFETYCVDDVEMIDYIDEDRITNDQVIILASGSTDDLDRPLVTVVKDTEEDEEYITCDLDLDGTSELTTKS